MRLFFFLTLAAILFEAPVMSYSWGQSPDISWREQRMAIERDFGHELQEIAQWCRENKIPERVDPTLDLYLNRDLGRQYIFSAPTLPMPPIGEGLAGQWQKKINEANTAHGARIFELARKASGDDAGAIAFQLLHEVLHHDRDHVAVRKMLGHVKKDDGWRVSSDSIRVRTAKTNHDIIKWPKNSYLRVLTPHFEIESNADEERTRFLARQLERTHMVWRQVFFEYWSSSAAVKRWIQGKGAARMSSKRFRVVFFVNRNSYLKHLAPLVRGVEVSTGYYNSDQEVSYFYDGDDRAMDTWRHELTHQLFRESGRANKQAFEKQFIWLDEGIATYFESMTDFGCYVTLGGFDARRLQYARMRRLLENYHVPMKELSAIGRTGLQNRKDIAQVYSESAGLTDMLINGSKGVYEQRLTQFLKLIYKGRVKQNAFESIMGQTFEELDNLYPKHLKVGTDLVENHLSKPTSRTELSLPAAKLTPAAFDMIGRCINLTLLDLSRNRVSSDDLARLKSCRQIDQLFMVECQIEPGALGKLVLFPGLDDLDLSGSSVRDSQLVNLKNLHNLTSLRLAATRITDKGLMELSKLKSLEMLDLTGTNVTNQGISSLKSRLPELQVTR